MKLTYTTAALVTATMVAASSAGAQVIVDDNFADGSPLNSGAVGESAFFNTSSGSALDDPANLDGAGEIIQNLDFASGSSGRAIHTVFAPQTLTNIGDTISSSLTFSTPSTVGFDENNGLRFGLFDQGGQDLAQNISASSGTPNPLLGDTGFVASGTLTGPAGFSADYDVNDIVGGGDFTLQDEVQIRQTDLTSATGRLLTTTGGFSSITGGVDAPPSSNQDPTAGLVGDSNEFAPDTEYQVLLSITLVSATEVEVTTSLESGGSVIHGASGTATADSLEFSLLALGVSSGAFGSSNSVGDLDNGLSITNANVTFTPVPEPASLTLLAAGAGLLVSRRRKG